MARKPKPTKTGLYYAREARGLSSDRAGRTLGRLQAAAVAAGEWRDLDAARSLKAVCRVLGYTPEQILLWGRYPGTGSIEDAGKLQSVNPGPGDILELDARPRQGRPVAPAEPESWSFPRSFVAERLHASAAKLRVLEIEGDAMAPTIMAGDRVVIDTGHKDPTPDGLYAIRDPLGGIVVRRLQVLRSARPVRVKVICDNQSHATEEVAHTQLDVLGKAVCCLKIL